jgi:hypothetical protein
MRRHLALLVSCCSLLVACGDEGSDDPASQVETPPTPVPLAAADFRVGWGIPGAPSVLPPGAKVPVSVEVKNLGKQAWMDATNSPGGAHAVRIGYRWWRAGAPPEALTDFGPERGELSRMVTPGSTAVATVMVTAPNEPGSYLLQIDLVQELVAWFERRGAEKLLVPVTVK